MQSRVLHSITFSLPLVQKLHSVNLSQERSVVVVRIGKARWRLQKFKLFEVSTGSLNFFKAPYGLIVRKLS